MCLITEQIKPEITKRDMIVYKSLWKKKVSAFYFFHWTKNKIETVKLSFIIVNTKKSYTGEYTFADNIAQEKYDKRKENLTCVNHGFHACITKKRCKEFATKNKPICKFKIHRGSEIFKDATGLIVSNKMMLIE